MKLKDYQEYWPFFLSIIFFIIIIIFSSVIYLRWDNGIEDDESLVEITLPVIKWGKYTNLSKKHENAINLNNN